MANHPGLDPANNPFVVTAAAPAESVVIADPSATSFGIMGEGWSVKIMAKDGSLETSGNYNPNEAARVFWQAVSNEYREFIAWKEKQTTGNTPA